MSWVSVALVSQRAGDQAPETQPHRPLPRGLPPERYNLLNISLPPIPGPRLLQKVSQHSNPTQVQGSFE